MGMFDNNPCRGCEERYPGCHAECERHEAWKARMKEIKEEKKKHDTQDRLVRMTLFDSSVKRKQRCNIVGRK